MTVRTTALAALILGGAMFAAAPAYAEVINMSAELNGASEVPANDSAGTGMLEATYDTDSNEFAWTVTYDGLTGEATAAHFHGPAAPDATASPVVPIEGPMASPITGTATLTDDQATALQDGMWYFNVHTAAHPDGEIRGQVMAAAM
ncbi:CHRD domain-containing protein [uncultured Devosia sp.]|uniref:CHRD domain-containing protein n=1 Tax=uncultured Devosia sp. TaxID=211434 RepID=UPI0035CB38FA